MNNLIFLNNGLPFWTIHIPSLHIRAVPKIPITSDLTLSRISCPLSFPPRHSRAQKQRTMTLLIKEGKLALSETKMMKCFTDSVIWFDNFSLCWLHLIGVFVTLLNRVLSNGVLKRITAPHCAKDRAQFLKKIFVTIFLIERSRKTYTRWFSLSQLLNKLFTNLMKSISLQNYTFFWQ